MCDRGDLTLIVAQEQTAGRGQWGRKWHSPKGQLYVTFVFFRVGADPVLLAEQVQKVLAGIQVEAEIKLPNDLLVEGKKIAGILTERTGDAVIMGLGLNLDLPASEQEKIDQPAIGIRQVTGVAADREQLIESIAQLLRHELIQLRDHH